MQLEGKTTALSENKAGGDQPDQSNINVASAQTPGGVPSLEERFPVEFPDTMRKAVPGGYMHVDQALDSLGLHRFPEDWGMSPVWQEHPYQFESPRQRFYRYRIKRKENGSYVLSKRQLKTSLPEDALLAADEIYCCARDELRHALEEGRIEAFFLTSAHEPEPIPRGSMLWATQMRSIFYVGYARHPSTGRKHRVLLKRSSFAAWLNPAASGDQVVRNSSQTALDHLGGELQQFAAVKQVQFPEKWLFELLQTIFREERRHLSERRFGTAIWEKLGAARHGAHRPKAALKASLEASRPDLTQIVRRVIRDQAA